MPKTFMVQSACAPKPDCGKGDFCSKPLPGCKNGGCLSIDQCKPFVMRIPLPTCNPCTGEEITAADVTDIVVSAATNVGGYQSVFAYSLATDAAMFAAGGDHYTLTIPATETAGFPMGVASLGAIEITAAGCTWKPYTAAFCISGKTYAEPCPIVTGIDGGDSMPAVAGGILTLYLHESDTLQGAGDQANWCSFTVDWGDGSPLETLDVSTLGDPDAATWNLSHEYEDGNYDICVTGYTCGDAADPCNPVLMGVANADNVCIQSIPLTLADAC